MSSTSKHTAIVGALAITVTTITAVLSTDHDATAVSSPSVPQAKVDVDVRHAHGPREWYGFAEKRQRPRYA